jgi:hypothetical protein
MEKFEQASSVWTRFLLTRCRSAMNPCRLLSLAILAIAAVQSRVTVATPIFESATGGPGDEPGGFTVNAQQFLGARFTLNAATDISYVGGLFRANYDDTKVFAAIVALNGASAMPGVTPLDANSVLASAVFTVSPLDQDVYVPLTLTLGPGTYGLVFGQGMFGADETAYRSVGMPDFNLVVSGYDGYFGSTGKPTSSWRNMDPQVISGDPALGLRFFVGTGDVLSVPEKGNTGALLALALTCLFLTQKPRLRLAPCRQRTC